MSNNVNVELYERASRMIDYWEGTLHAKLIEHALGLEDLDQLNEAVSQAEATAGLKEVEVNECL